MKTIITLLLILLNSVNLSAQELTGKQLLDKSIQYHDPTGAWNTFNAEFTVRMKTPTASDRLSDIIINIPEEYFSVTAVRDTIKTVYTINKGVCNTNIAKDAPKQNRTPCETAALYKNYYTYLYGLPMKLKDEGTIISETVTKRTFKGKEYLVLQVNYTQKVGSDVWFFYFDPATYAMEVYQFFKGDPEAEGANTGEYILLTEEVLINKIKMPKNRAWYYNKDDGYLGTDILE
ncbi:DUF6503 family protein [Patiriisocius hiemis]|uniref:DUF6503 family protein n=1 Tax=Patiriisocius hiemis TaxID=3075604 RepID=A0ABU2YC01_9FLAO|nr:DUF6503 family protein [Constantimarinum sp. W242]MDT0555330.1 DUF6503 family protein [Constantimarinum sp. W242]